MKKNEITLLNIIPLHLTVYRFLVQRLHYQQLVTDVKVVVNICKLAYMEISDVLFKILSSGFSIMMMNLLKYFALSANITHFVNSYWIFPGDVTKYCS